MSKFLFKKLIQCGLFKPLIHLSLLLWLSFLRLLRLLCAMALFSGKWTVLMKHLWRLLHHTTNSPIHTHTRCYAANRNCHTRCQLLAWKSFNTLTHSLGFSIWLKDWTTKLLISERPVLPPEPQPPTDVFIVHAACADFRFFNTLHFIVIYKISIVMYARRQPLLILSRLRCHMVCNFTVQHKLRLVQWQTSAQSFQHFDMCGESLKATSPACH